jgi:hypothetical protein
MVVDLVRDPINSVERETLPGITSCLVRRASDGAHLGGRKLKIDIDFGSYWWSNQNRGSDELWS